MPGQGRRWRQPNISSLSRGRGKLGPAPVRMLFEQVAGPIGDGRGAGGVLLRAAGRLDGRVGDGRAGQRGERRVLRPARRTSPGTGRSRRSGGWRRPSPGPGACSGRRSARTGTAEQPLARDLLERCFGPGMLVLADRKFLSWSLARDFLATGAHILWRASASFTLKPVKVLADGTYLAELKPPRKSDGPPLTVRVIEYTVHTAPEDGGDEETSEVFCLVTEPARRRRSTRRWTWRAATRTGGDARPSSATTRRTWARASPCCAARTPPGVEQEMWALFAVYQAICKIIGIGGDRRGHPPGHGSASRTPWPPRRTPSRLFPPEQADLALATFLLKILMPGFFVRDRPGPGQPPQNQEIRRLPRPQARRAQRHQRHPENRVPPAHPWQIT